MNDKIARINNLELYTKAMAELYYFYNTAFL